MTDQERKEVAIRELRILGAAIRGNWGTLDGRIVRDDIESIVRFLAGDGENCDAGRVFYHYNNTVDCGLGRCDEWDCPICRLEGRYDDDSGPEEGT